MRIENLISKNNTTLQNAFTLEPCIQGFPGQGDANYFRRVKTHDTVDFSTGLPKVLQLPIVGTVPVAARSVITFTLRLL